MLCLIFISYKIYRFPKKKCNIDECDHGSEQKLSVGNCSSKKAKPRHTRKYDES